MIFDATALVHLTARSGVAPRWYVWIMAKDRATGDPATLGLWTGDESVSLTVDGEARTYAAGGAIVDVGTFTFEPGPVVRRHKMTFSPLSAEVAQALRGYEPRLAPVEVHLGLHDPASLGLLSLVKVFSGRIDKAPIVTPARGGTASASIELASSSRDMTRTLALKKSDESQQRRAGDRFRRYADISGAVGIWWGEKREEVK